METIDRKEGRFIAAIRSGGRQEADVCMAPDQSVGGKKGLKRQIKEKPLYRFRFLLVFVLN